MLVMSLPLYFVQPLPAVIGKSVVVEPTQYEPSPDQMPYRRPGTLAIARDGTAAYVAGSGFNNFSDQIIVVRHADGTRTILKRPADTLLAARFGPYAPGPRGVRTYPYTQIEGIALTDAGDPFVTVGEAFAGAFPGYQEASYSWTDGGWRYALPGRPATDATNVRAAAVETPARGAFVADYLNNGPADAAMRRGDPHYHSDTVLLLSRAYVSVIGYGIATSLNATEVVGYQIDPPDVSLPSQRATAVVWTAQGRRVPLGTGIAWAVNAHGDIIGDDRPTLASAGHPTLWRAGHAERLSELPGSAYAVGDDGTIVGDIASGGFVVRAGDRSPRAIPLDALISDRGWHIVHAYGVSSHNDILCIGKKRGQLPQVVVLRGN